ncbi:hypothetical protein HK102_003515 [Quaeritorhiza haematococci]|nr:hypothetical protein HK102_003515 [Quaeritorhiza haematococci]
MYDTNTENGTWTNQDRRMFPPFANPSVDANLCAVPSTSLADPVLLFLFGTEKPAPASSSAAMSVYVPGAMVWDLLYTANEPAPDLSDGTACSVVDFQAAPNGALGINRTTVYCFGATQKGAGVWVLEVDNRSKRGRWELRNSINADGSGISTSSDGKQLAPSPRFGSNLAIVNNTYLVVWGGGQRQRVDGAEESAFAEEQDGAAVYFKETSFGDQRTYYFNIESQQWIENPFVRFASSTVPPDGGSQSTFSSGNDSSSRTWVVIVVPILTVLIFAMALTTAFVLSRRSKKRKATTDKQQVPLDSSNENSSPPPLQSVEIMAAASADHHHQDLTPDTPTDRTSGSPSSKSDSSGSKEKSAHRRSSQAYSRMKKSPHRHSWRTSSVYSSNPSNPDSLSSEEMEMLKPLDGAMMLTEDPEEEESSVDEHRIGSENAAPISAPAPDTDAADSVYTAPLDVAQNRTDSTSSAATPVMRPERPLSAAKAGSLARSSRSSLLRPPPPSDEDRAAMGAAAAAAAAVVASTSSRTSHLRLDQRSVSDLRHVEVVSIDGTSIVEADDDAEGPVEANEEVGPVAAIAKETETDAVVSRGVENEDEEKEFGETSNASTQPTI